MKLINILNILALSICLTACTGEDNETETPNIQQPDESTQTQQPPSNNPPDFEGVITTIRDKVSNVVGLTGTVTDQEGLQSISVIVWPYGEQEYEYFSQDLTENSYDLSGITFPANFFKNGSSNLVEIFVKDSNDQTTLEQITILFPFDLAEESIERPLIPLGKEVVFDLSAPDGDAGQNSAQMRFVGLQGTYDYLVEESRGWDNRTREFGVERDVGMYLLKSIAHDDDRPDLDFEDLLARDCIEQDEVPFFMYFDNNVSETRQYNITDNCEVEDFQGLQISISERPSGDSKRVSLAIRLDSDNRYVTQMSIDADGVFEITEYGIEDGDYSGIFNAQRMEIIDFMQTNSKSLN